MTVKDFIADHILKHHLKGEKRSNLKDDTSLIKSGIIDSLGLMTLVSALEKKFNMEFTAADLVDHDTINHFARTIEKRKH